MEKTILNRQICYMPQGECPVKLNPIVAIRPMIIRLSPLFSFFCIRTKGKIIINYTNEQYSPDDKTVGAKYAEKSFHRTEIICLDIETISGKGKTVRS